MPPAPQLTYLPTYNQAAQSQPQRDSLWSLLGSSAVSTYGNLRYGLPAAVERLAGTLTPQDEKYYAAWNKYEQDKAQSMAPIGAASFGDVTSGRVGLGRAVLENLAQSAPIMAGELLGGAAGGALGGPVGAIAGAAAAGAPTYVGSNASRALSETGGLSGEQAVKSVAYAPLQAAGDVAEELLLPGVGKIFGGLASTASGGLLTRVAKQVGKGFAVEALTETGQQMAERDAAGLPMTTPEAQQEFLQAFTTGGMVGGVVGGVGGVFNKHAAEHTNADLEKLADAGMAGEPLSMVRAGMTVQPEQQLEIPGLFRPKLNEVAPNTQLDLFGPQYDARPDRPAQVQDTPVAAGPVAAPVEQTQAELPLGPNFQQFPAGYQGDLFQNPTYDALQKALADVPTATLEAVKSKAGKAAVAPQIIGAVEQELAARKTGKEAPAAAPTFEGLFDKVRLNQDLAQLKGKTQEEVVAGVRSLLENNDVRKGTWDVAERLQQLGLLDLGNGETKANVAPEAAVQATQEAAPAPQAQTQSAVSPAIAPVEVQPSAEEQAAPAPKSLLDHALELTQEGRQSFIQMLPEQDRTQLAQQALQEMGSPSPDGLTEKQAQSRSDAIVALTDHLGLTDKNGLTEAGKQAALTAPVPTEEVIQAAQAHGFEGADAAMFERGATGAQVDNFDSLSSMGAYIAGQKWKVPETSSQTQTQTTLYGNGQKAGTLTDGGKTRDRSLVGRVESANPEFERKDSLVRAIDQRQAEGRYAKAKPEDVEQLRRMVREGATDEQVNAADELVRQGETLFPEPARNTNTTFEGGQTVTRGAPTQASVERAQLQARDEINQDFKEGKITAAERDAQISQLKVGNMVSDDLGLGRDATRREVAAAKRARAEAQNAKKLQQAREKVRDAFRNGDIDRRTFIRLTQVLNEGNTGEALSSLEDPQAPLRNQLRDEHGDPLAHEAVAMEVELEGASHKVALDYLVDHATNALERTIAKAVRATIDSLEKAGMKFEFKVAHQGDMVPRALIGAAGLTSIRDGKATVWISGSDLKGNVGMSYDTLMHEMIHAATSAAIETGRRYSPRSPLGAAVRDLFQLTDHIIQNTNQILRDPAIKAAYEQARAEGLTPLQARDRMVAAGAPKAAADAFLGANILDNPREVVAWGLSDPSFQRYLDSIPYTSQASLWDKFVEAVRNVLGLSPKEDTALKALLEISERIMGTTESSAERILTDGKWIADAKSSVLDARLPLKGAVDKTTETLREAIPQLDRAVEKINPQTFSAKARKVMFGWLSMDHIASVYGDMLRGLRDIPKIDAERHATHAKLAQLFSPLHQEYGQLKPDYQTRTQNLMRATEFGVDPGKAWEDQPWLHDLPNAPDIKAALASWQNDLHTLRRNKADHVYEGAKALNEAVLYSEMAVSLHNLVNLDPELQKSIAGFDHDPMAGFREDPNVSTNPMQAKAYWGEQLKSAMDNVQKFIDDFRGSKINLEKKQQAVVEQRLAPIELRMRTIQQSLDRIKQAPYFHLGRHGDQYVSFQVRSDRGVSDQAAVKRVAEAFDKAGFNDVYISSDNTRPGMYVRFDSIDARTRAESVLRDLKAGGWLDSEAAIEGGPRATGGWQTKAMSAGQLDEMINMISASPAFDTTGLNKDEAKEVREQRDHVISQIRELWMDTLSDTALTKVMVKRKGVAGYTADMMRNYATRYQMHALALANLSAAPHVNDAVTQMRAAVNQARNTDDKNHANVQTMFDLQNEVLQRQYQRGQIEKTIFADKLRAVTNSFFLGLSPGYVMTQLTQLPVLLLPELGKKHGYAKSFGAIASHTGTAFKIMRAVFEEGKKRGLDGIADMAITPDVLKKAGISNEQVTFLNKMIASGSIDIGSAARELGRVAEGETDSKLDRYTRWATSAGLYAETLTRLTAALAAHDLHADGKARGTAEEYAQHVINEAMFNYASSNTARQMGKGSSFGPYTPMFTQFMQYGAQVLQKLYRETHAAFGGDVEARKFLAGHFAALTALAGTMGLPFATMAATATEKLVDLFGGDDEPYDATAAWRNWLASIFGEKIGMTLARGIPRGMLNFDLSERIGEQDLLPFTNLLSDRRNLKDALQGNAYQSLGAPFSMVAGIMMGLRDISNGNVLAGMQQATPVFMANIIKAASAASTGQYTSNRGDKLPIHADGWDALTQLLGFNPTDKAEYSEKNRDYNELKTSATVRGTVLRNQIVRALISGDTETARAAIEKAQKFDQDNPDFRILPTIEGAVRAKVQRQAVAQQTGLPVGVKPQSIQARELLAY